MYFKKWGSPSSFRRKRAVISLNCSAAFIETEGARANHAKNDAQKECAMQLKVNVGNKNFNYNKSVQQR